MIPNGAAERYLRTACLPDALAANTTFRREDLAGEQTPSVFDDFPTRAASLSV